MNLVVLGDCASSGTNCLAWQVTGNDAVNVRFSLAYNNDYNEIIKWYMHQRKQGKFTDPVKMQYIQQQSLKALTNAELEVAWPTFLDCTVFNYSVIGNTFQGYISDLKKHISMHGMPDCVCITDFSEDHVYVRVNSNNEKYSGVVHRGWLGSEYNSNTMSYTKQIFDKKQKQGRKEYNKGQAYLNKKSNHSFYFLKKFLEKNNINYFFVKFRDYDLSSVFDKERTLNIQKMHQVYTDRYTGDKSLLKHNCQSKIAQQIQSRLDK